MMHVDWSPAEDNKPRPRRRTQSQSQSGIRGIWNSLTGAFKDGNETPGSSSSHHHHQRSDSKHSSRSRPPPSRSNSKPSSYNNNSNYTTTQIPRGGTVIVVHHRRPSTPRVQVIQATPTPRRQQTAPPGYNYAYVSAPPTPQRRPSHPTQKMPSGNRTEGGTKVLAEADVVNEYMTSQTNVQKWLKKQAAMGY